MPNRKRQKKKKSLLDVFSPASIWAVALMLGFAYVVKKDPAIMEALNKLANDVEGNDAEGMEVDQEGNLQVRSEQ